MSAACVYARSNSPGADSTENEAVRLVAVIGTLAGRKPDELRKDSPESLSIDTTPTADDRASHQNTKTGQDRVEDNDIRTRETEVVPEGMASMSHGSSSNISKIIPVVQSPSVTGGTFKGDHTQQKQSSIVERTVDADRIEKYAGTEAKQTSDHSHSSDNDIERIEASGGQPPISNMATEQPNQKTATKHEMMTQHTEASDLRQATTNPGATPIGGLIKDQIGSGSPGKDLCEREYPHTDERIQTSIVHGADPVNDPSLQLAPQVHESSNAPSPELFKTNAESLNADNTDVSALAGANKEENASTFPPDKRRSVNIEPLHNGDVEDTGSDAEKVGSSSVVAEAKDNRNEPSDNTPATQASSAGSYNDARKSQLKTSEGGEDGVSTMIDSAGSYNGKQQLCGTLPPAYENQSKPEAISSPIASSDTGDRILQSVHSGSSDQARGNRRSQTAEASTMIQNQSSRKPDLYDAKDASSRIRGVDRRERRAAESAESSHNPGVSMSRLQRSAARHPNGNDGQGEWVFDLDNPPPLGP